MSRKCFEEFNPWPSFVDIFSSVILVLLLFLLVVLVNLTYYIQFKYKISYTGSITLDEPVLNNNRTMEENIPYEEKISDPAASTSSNSDIQAKVIDEYKQKILLLENQLKQDSTIGDKDAVEELESPGKDVADIRDDKQKTQDTFTKDNYILVQYKGNEIFVDAGNIREIKKFLSQAKDTAGKHKIVITAADIKGQISATISKQISLARAMSARTLVKKFGYKKSDVKISLQEVTNISENIDDKNGYLIIKIKK